MMLYSSQWAEALVRARFRAPNMMCFLDAIASQEETCVSRSVSQLVRPRF